ncbi:hypothetical protein [Cupriavidus sp. CP313]
MPLADFERRLHSLLDAHPTASRPFVCEGSPLDCRIVIAGINSASESPEPFWDYWQPGAGFHYSRFIEDYLEANNGKFRHTRRAINVASAAAAPFKCLETNLYATPSKTAQSLHKEAKSTKIFEFLLDAVRPDAILVHSVPAYEFLAELSGISTTELLRGPVRGKLFGKDVLLAATPHFRSTSHRRIEELMHQFGQHLLPPPREAA